MSLFVLSPDTVWNPSLLNIPNAPRKILQRGTLLPRRDVTWGFIWRTVFENQALRFLVPLLPFCIAALIWPSLALPFSGSPSIMLIVIAIVEMRVLRIPRHKRADIVAEADAARALDTLHFRGRRILASFAAGRGIEAGEVYLVVEQSDIARVAPLTVVSVQLDQGKSRLVQLTPAERAMIREELFDDAFTEQQLLLANLRESVFFRSVTFEARGVSAHARLAAFLDEPSKGGEVTA